LIADAVRVAQKHAVPVDQRLALIAICQDALAGVLETLGAERASAVETAADLVAANALQLLDNNSMPGAPDWHILYWVD
jgi:hypothetical protein